MKFGTRTQSVSFLPISTRFWINKIWELNVKCCEYNMTLNWPSLLLFLLEKRVFGNGPRTTHFRTISQNQSECGLPLTTLCTSQCEFTCQKVPPIVSRFTATSNLGLPRAIFYFATRRKYMLWITNAFYTRRKLIISVKIFSQQLYEIIHLRK